jgi:hypothetical protein
VTRKENTDLTHEVQWSIPTHTPNIHIGASIHQSLNPNTSIIAPPTPRFHTLTNIHQNPPQLFTMHTRHTTNGQIIHQFIRATVFQQRIGHGTSIASHGKPRDERGTFVGVSIGTEDGIS